MFYYSLGFYFSIVVSIAIISYFLNKNLSDFLLANKKLSAPVIGIGAGTADMSGWLMMGLPGTVFIFGLNQIWIIIGLLIGSFFNWHFLSKRLRVFTGNISECLTVPSYFSYRFEDKKGYLRLMMSLVMIFFFMSYASAGFIASAKVIQFCFDINYINSLLLVFLVIIIYIILGGFVALNWIDFFQGSMIMFSLIIIPFISFIQLGGLSYSMDLLHNISFHYTDIFYKTNSIMIISSLSWGLGYFGQPHILIRFMAIKNHNDIYIAKIIGISWMFISLTGALLLGFISILYFNHYQVLNPENVFIELTKRLYNQHILEGFMIGALLSAIISTISAQIIGVTSAIIEDIYRAYIRKHSTGKELIFLSRVSIIILSIVSAVIAIDPKTSILNKISFAWAGMGASFGPLILISLFHSRITMFGAMSGIFSGSVCVISFPYFKYLGGWFNLYELFPSFLLSSASIIIFSEIHIFFRSYFFNQKFRDNIYYVKMVGIMK